MTGKRDVGELESRVEELQATVRGLTEELVEANERIRMLEEEVAGEVAEPEPADARVEEAKPEQSQETEKEMEETGLSDDIIVA